MQAYWTTTKPDGTAITDGRLCRVVDPEDGSFPIYVYGKTADEVYSKIERTMMTAQTTLTTARNGNGNGNGNGGAQPPANGAGAAPPRSTGTHPVLSADETMLLTQDLQNPAKSAEASFKLQESETNKRLNAQEVYVATCRAWSSAHPEFFKHKMNNTLLINKALLTVGNDISKVTSDVLDSCYRHLQAGGFLLTESDVVPETPITNNEPSQVQPGGSPEPVPARPTGGVVSTTSHRSARLGAPQAPRWQPKLAKATIEKLTTKESEAILRGTHPTISRKDYDEACDHWYGRAQATA